MMKWFSEWWRGGTAVVEPAVARDVARLAQLPGASFARGWGEGEFEYKHNKHNTQKHQKHHSHKNDNNTKTQIGADEAEILSIAVDHAHRGRGLSRTLLMTHLGHLAGRGVRTIFLEVEENNQPARRLYDRTGFMVVGRRERYYKQPNGEQLNALLMRRDLT